MRNEAIPCLKRIVKDEKRGKIKVSLLEVETEFIINKRAVDDSGMIEKSYCGARIIILKLHIRDLK